MSEEDALRGLANGIVIQAVEDWRHLCKILKKTKAPKATPPYKFESLREFFNGEWCALLCGNVDPILILGALENERKEALNNINGGLQNVNLERL